MSNPLKKKSNILKRLNINLWGNPKDLKQRSLTKVLLNTNVDSLYNHLNSAHTSKSVYDTLDQTSKSLYDTLLKKQNELKKNKLKVIKKSSPYGERLLEKQKLKYFYLNINENTFKKYFETSKDKTYNLKKNTFDNYLIEQLELRLDTVLYRSKFFKSMNESKEAINHGFIYVNNKKTTIKSFLLKQNDIIEVKTTNLNIIRKIQENLKTTYYSVQIPEYLEINYKLLTMIVVNKPVIDTVNYPITIDFDKIKEFYR